MKLTVLGSSAAISNPKSEYRFPAAHLIEANNKRTLLDASIGVLPQLNALDLGVADVEAICISHFHADHCNLQPILQAYFLEGKFGDVKPSLHVCGPPGIKKRVVTGFDQSGFSYDTDLVPNVDLTISEYADRQHIELPGAMTLTPYKTRHYDLDAYALQIEHEGKLFTYSGDSTLSDGLRNAAQNTDLFLCEAASRVGAESDAGHLTPYDAAELAKSAHAKRVVLTHYSGYDSEIAMLESAGETDFPGEITVARDLSSYSL